MDLEISNKYYKASYCRNGSAIAPIKIEVKEIEDITEFNCIEGDANFERIVDEEKIISIGFILIKAVKKMDMSFAAMITNTYFSCILLATATFYSSSTMFFDTSKKELILSSTASLSMALLCLFRLCWITYCGHILMRAMRTCAYHLDKFKFINARIDADDVQNLKQDLRHYSESPINPFLAFTVSTSTLVGTIGTIITYIIVLLQFKISEPQIISPGGKNETAT